jgi:hypothetical protein
MIPRTPVTLNRTIDKSNVLVRLLRSTHVCEFDQRTVMTVRDGSDIPP